jgi:hypothetical protein
VPAASTEAKSSSQRPSAYATLDRVTVSSLGAYDLLAMEKNGILLGIGDVELTGVVEDPGVAYPRRSGDVDDLIQATFLEVVRAAHRRVVPRALPERASAP